MTPAHERSEHLHKVCTIIENQIRLIQTMMSFMNTMCALGCFVTGGKKGDINPRSRARNSRLRESQGWPLDHSLFFFLSLSLSLQQSPIILWNFTISNLCPAFSANYISTPQREMFKLTKIIPFKLLTTHWSKRYTCVQTYSRLWKISVSTCNYESRSAGHTLRMPIRLNSWAWTLFLLYPKQVNE